MRVVYIEQIRLRERSFGYASALFHYYEKLFRDLVPYLILLASGLLALQDPVRKWVARRTAAAQGSAEHARRNETWAALPVRPSSSRLRTPASTLCGCW